MSTLTKSEETLNGIFKGLPPISEKGKESLVQAWPWIALVVGILQLSAAYFLWHLTRVINALNTLVNSLYTYTHVSTGLSTTDKVAIYIGVVILVAQGLLLLAAFGKLRARSKQGWDLVFMSGLLNVVYAVVALFVTGRGVGSFIWSLLASAVGFYLLFQVKDKYKTV